MRVMVLLKGHGSDEDKAAPTPEMFEAMGRYNDELVKAGIMLDGQGLQPSSAGAQVVFEGGTTSVVDGPFTESKEVLAGYWIWQVNSLEEAVEWAKRCPSDPQYGQTAVLELRPIFEIEDFGDAYTPEQAAHDAELADKIRSQQGQA